ncbi:MAG: hypothetical protein JNK89_09115 [Saprospiraceae bacterium]|nr:hypothetical protein [Saprospiraceae bacterium]
MRLYLAFSALLFFAACHPEPAQRSLALYHWKNQFQLDTAEIRYLDQLGCRALYLKFLDIARDETGAIRP